MSDFHPGLVHIRTPTYKRPAALRRALQSMIDQTWPLWVCDVFDDDAEESGRAVVESLGDARIRYRANSPQLFASRNIDQCFSALNPHRAEYFCVVEDDNFILPDFCAANIALMQEQGVEIVLRNQLIEHASGTTGARVGDAERHTAAGAPMRQSENQPRRFRRAPIDVRIDAEAPVCATQQRPLAPDELEAGPPDQRAIAENPVEVVAAPLTGGITDRAILSLLIQSHCHPIASLPAGV